MSLDINDLVPCPLQTRVTLPVPKRLCGGTTGAQDVVCPVHWGKFDVARFSSRTPKKNHYHQSTINTIFYSIRVPHPTTAQQ